MHTHEAADAVPDAVELADRLAFLGLDENDRGRLRALIPLLSSSADAFVETFYRHLFAFGETARFLDDPELVARLKQAQQQHLTSMLEADWNEAYVRRRYRVGDVHAQVGIDPHIFLGAYNQYLQFCIREMTSKLDPRARLCVEQLLSLQKAVFLDIGLTLKAYFTQATQNLRQALDLLHKANGELRQFAQLASHDLKTPLATMANLCDEALDEFGADMPAEATKLVQAARTRAFRMSATIDELLSSTMSLQSAEQDEVVSSESAMAEAVDQVRPLLEKGHIELVMPDKLPRVVGDRVRIREVFYNLLSNAVKFSDKSRGRITIGYEVHDGECVFSIADNGPGIPAEELSRIFVPFRRLDTHRNIPGSGLGLYFAKTMVEQQRGRIWAESHVGKGSCFFVALKLPEGHEAPSPAA
jgi:signal transduction histidine kinase